MLENRTCWATLLEQGEGQQVLVAGELLVRRVVHGRLDAESDDSLLMRLHGARRCDLPGGAAAVAGALVLAGAQVAVCGIVGDDPPGHMLLDRLAAAGVDTRSLFCEKHWETPVLIETVTLDARGHVCPLLQKHSPSHDVPVAQLQAQLHEAARQAAAEAQWIVLSDGGPEYLRSLVAGLQEVARSRGVKVVTAPAYVASGRLQSETTSADKSVSLKELLWLASQQREQGLRMVFTNGCFDLLHAGHVRYLQAAAACGDYLILALNSDASVRAIKGPGRPILDEQQRATVLSALDCVDAVVVFSSEDVCPLLDALRPEVYVKGGDYAMDTINQQERRLVERYGGQIVLLPGEEGASTTSIIQRIQGQRTE